MTNLEYHLCWIFIAKGDRFEFYPDCILDWNDGTCLEYKSRQHRAELVNGRWIIAVQQHIPAPVTNAYHERFDLEVAGRLPLREDLKDPLLRIFVLDRGALRAFGLAGC